LFLALSTMTPPLALACALFLQAPPPPAQQQSRPLHELHLADDSELELTAAWEPCRTSTYGLFHETPVLRKPAPARERERYDGALFRPFLPGKAVALGEVWEVDGQAILDFLRQFHAGAVLRAGFGGGEVPGTYACLRALSEDAFEILLRAHAAFELEDGVIYKPAQFEGRLVVERASGKLLSFRLELPSRDPNVDVNVPAGYLMEYVLEDGTQAQGMSADIGWVPRMELASGDPPELAWSQELPLEEARLKLRTCFYAFAALGWLPFEEAVLRAQAEQKPLHLVLLFGALDDDSC
jgi:hypothetical protein